MNSGFEIPKPKLILSRLVYEKIMHFVTKGNQHECSGLGLTEIDGDRVIVKDVWMVKQQNAATTTDLDAEAINKLMFEQRNADGSLNFWWHSHADMSVFWSATDKDTIRQIAGGGLCFAAVFNKKREVKAAVSALTQLPFIENPVPVFLDDITVEIESMVDENILAAWNKEYDDNVVKYSHRSLYSGTGMGLHNIGEDYQSYDRTIFWENYKEAKEKDIDFEGASFEVSNGRYRKSKAQIDADEMVRKETASRRSLPETTTGTKERTTTSISEAELAEKFLDEEVGKWDLLVLDPNVEDYNPVHDVVIMKDGTLVTFDDWIAAKKRTQQLLEAARGAGIPAHGFSEDDRDWPDHKGWSERQ